MKQIQLKLNMTLIWPFNVIQGKLLPYKVNWTAIYDLLYVFHTNLDHTITVMSYNLLKVLWPLFGL